MNTRPAVGRVVGDPRLHRPRERDRIDQRIQDHPPHPPREHVGVGLTEERAIRLTAVMQTPVADQAPQVVQIANRVRGRDVRQQPAAARLAAPRIPDRLGHVAPGLQRRRRDRPIGTPEAQHAPLIGEATNMRAGARTAGIPADDVEPPSRQPVEGRPGGAHVRRPRHAGAAEIHEQRPDPPAPVAGAIANYRQRNRRSGRHHAPGAHGGA